MAKKTVASLQDSSSKNFTKVVKMARSSKTGAYSFQEEVVTKDKVDGFFKG